MAEIATKWPEFDVLLDFERADSFVASPSLVPLVHLWKAVHALGRRSALCGVRDWFKQMLPMRRDRFCAIFPDRAEALAALDHAPEPPR